MSLTKVTVGSKVFDEVMSLTKVTVGRNVFDESDNHLRR